MKYLNIKFKPNLKNQLSLQVLSNNVILLRTFTQFARIHTSSLIKTEKTLNRPITKFYNGDDVNVIAAELRLAKTRPTSFNKKHNLLLETMPTDVNRVLKTNYQK